MSGIFARGPIVDDSLTRLRLCRILFDGCERAEEEAGDVGQHGSASRRDAVLGDENVELGERSVDALDGLQGLFEVGEFGSDIGGFGGE